MRTEPKRQEVDQTDVIVEFVRIGALVRVSAMEPISLTEVVIQGPAAAGEAALRRTALRKLAHVLNRKTVRRDEP